MSLYSIPFLWAGLLLESHLSPEECRERLWLNIATAEDYPHSFRTLLGLTFPDKPLDGVVWSWGFMVDQPKPGRDSFKTFAIGRLSKTQGGTRIQVILGMHPLVILLILSFLAIAWIGTLTSKPSSARIDLVGPLVISVIIILFTLVGRLWSLSEEGPLGVALKNIFEAEEVTGSR